MSAQVSRGFKREEHDSACATVATSAAGCETTQSLGVKMRTGNRGSCKVCEYWHESSTRPRGEGCFKGLRQHTNWPQSDSRHATPQLSGQTTVFLILNYNFKICKRSK
ncbi:hypothetical protein ABVT39_010852 [Epinephelus coioides]